MNKRGRGRPPKNDDASTPDRLLDAATAEFAERGLEAATVASIASRVGVSAAAVYNHFPSKEALLYGAARRALYDLVATMASSADSPPRLTDLAELYLQPGMATARTLLLELHLASIRHPELAADLAQWHRDVADQLIAAGVAGPDALATIKALFLLLLGLCHIDQFEAMEVDRDALRERVTAMVRSLTQSPARPGRTRNRDG